MVMSNKIVTVAIFMVLLAAIMTPVAFVAQQNGLSSIVQSSATRSQSDKSDTSSVTPKPWPMGLDPRETWSIIQPNAKCTDFESRKKQKRTQSCRIDSSNLLLVAWRIECLKKKRARLAMKIEDIPQAMPKPKQVLVALDPRKAWATLQLNAKHTGLEMTQQKKQKMHGELQKSRRDSSNHFLQLASNTRFLTRKRDRLAKLKARRRSERS